LRDLTGPLVRGVPIPCACLENRPRIDLLDLEILRITVATVEHHARGLKAARESGRIDSYSSRLVEGDGVMRGSYRSRAETHRMAARDAVRYYPESSLMTTPIGQVRLDMIPLSLTPSDAQGAKLCPEPGQPHALGRGGV
jgi:hypothetical protein